MSPQTEGPVDLSTKTRRKLRLEEFLRQNLDQAPAARVIQWVDRESGIFRILWTHQSSGAFTQQDAALFRYWALARGKPPSLSSVELKQSLRMALNKSPSVERLAVTNDEYRYFRFTDWRSRRSAPSTAKGLKTQENTRKRSSAPGNPPPLVPIKHPSPGPTALHPDVKAARDGFRSPNTEDNFRGLLGTGSRTSFFCRLPGDAQESCPGEHWVDSQRFRSPLAEEQCLWEQISSKQLTFNDQPLADSTLAYSFMREAMTNNFLAREYKNRENLPGEPPVGNHLLGEHLSYLPQAHSPQACSEPLHSVPTYREHLPRQDFEGHLSLYSDGNHYSKVFHHYDYRSPGASSYLYSVPDQSLPQPHDHLDARLSTMQC